MIQKLRKKLMLVLMSVMCVFLAVILISLFFGAQNSYAHLRSGAVNPPAQGAQDNRKREARPPMAAATVEGDGSILISRNELYYLTDEELETLVAELEKQPEDAGEASEYEMRYARHVRGGRKVYLFADTTIERNSLRAQLLLSAVIAACAAAVCLVISFFLSGWMVRPVERVWEKQRRFIADASHELKTPLTVILSNTDMLLASGAAADEKNARRLDNIRAESQRMKGLVEGLLTLARSDGQQQDPSAQRIHFSFLVTSATLTMESAIYDTGRTLEMNIEENLFVRGNEDQLHQVTEILLDNACKYSDAASRIILTLARQGKEAVLSVQNQGEPLSDRDCINIFERFYRLDESRSREAGYGLGLSIAHSIIQWHGGKIEARSDGVRTNEFIVHLPLAAGEASA